MSSLPLSKTGALSPVTGKPAQSPSPKEFSPAESSARALLQRKLEEIVVLTRESTNADGVAVALRENGQFYCRASLGFAPEPGVVVEPGQGVCGRCIIDARVLVCQDLSGDVKSAVAAPVIVGDEIEGLLAAFSFTAGAFNTDHIDLVSRVAVDIGNLVSSPETIHLVSRDPVSILNSPHIDVVAVDPAIASREKHLEVLEAVTAPALASMAREPLQDATEESVPRPFHFLGYDEAAPAEPEPERLSSDQLLGEYLSKWDIAVIFGAILIAMLAFSLYLHHKRSSQPYVAPYTPEPVETRPAPSNSNTAQPSASPAENTSKPSTRPKSTPEPKKKAAAEATPISVAGGSSVLAKQESAPPPVQGSTTAISSVPLPSQGLANVELAPAPSGPTAPAELVHKVDPVYPSAARAANEASVVSLDLRVETTGRIGTIKVVSGNNPFVSSAINAVRQWRYEPAVQNGKKIESMVRVDIAFSPR